MAEEWGRLRSHIGECKYMFGYNDAECSAGCRTRIGIDGQRSSGRKYCWQRGRRGQRLGDLKLAAQLVYKKEMNGTIKLELEGCDEKRRN